MRAAGEQDVDIEAEEWAVGLLARIRREADVSRHTAERWERRAAAAWVRDCAVVGREQEAAKEAAEWAKRNWDAEQEQFEFEERGGEEHCWWPLQSQEWHLEREETEELDPEEFVSAFADVLGPASEEAVGAVGDATPGAASKRKAEEVTPPKEAEQVDVKAEQNSSKWRRQQ